MSSTVSVEQFSASTNTPEQSVRCLLDGRSTSTLKQKKKIHILHCVGLIYLVVAVLKLWLSGAWNAHLFILMGEVWQDEKNKAHIYEKRVYSKWNEFAPTGVSYLL